MTRRKTNSRTKRAALADRWLMEVLAAYAGRGAKGVSLTRADASQQIDDLAMHVPGEFWRLMELAMAGDMTTEELRGLGDGPLMWLLRYHPDDYDKRVAGMARREGRMRALIAEIDPDRIAPGRLATDRSGAG